MVQFTARTIYMKIVLSKTTDQVDVHSGMTSNAPVITTVIRIGANQVAPNFLTIRSFKICEELFVFDSIDLPAKNASGLDQ